MNVEGVLESIVQATLNYIIVNQITSTNQKQTVTDLKTDLRTTKEDIMAEVKSSNDAILSKLETDTTALNEIIKSKGGTNENI